MTQNLVRMQLYDWPIEQSYQRGGPERGSEAAVIFVPRDRVDYHISGPAIHDFAAKVFDVYNAAHGTKIIRWLWSLPHPDDNPVLDTLVAGILNPIEA